METPPEFSFFKILKEGIMKNLLSLAILLINSWVGYSQIILEDFSDISRSITSVSELITIKDGFVVSNFLNIYDTSKIDKWRRYMNIYKIDQTGKIVKHISLEAPGKEYAGIVQTDNKGRLFFVGSSFVDSLFYSQRYCVIEFDDDFNIVRETEYPVIPYRIGYTVFRSTDYTYYGRSICFQIYNDTFYIAGSGLYGDSLKPIIGRQTYYFKAHLNGEVYQDKQLNGEVHSCSFEGDRLYIFGINSYQNNPYLLASGVATYDSDGNATKTWALATSYPVYFNGSVIEDKFYFSYPHTGYLPGVGCSDASVAIDIRYVNNFSIYRRFKIKECGYWNCSNTPFVKGKDGNIYYVAYHPNHKKFLVQKYTPDMQRIWSKEFTTHLDTYERIVPMQMLPTEDGGVIIRCYFMDGGIHSRFSLHRISADGDPVFTSVIDMGEILQSSVLSPNPFHSIVRYTGAHEGPLMAMVHSMDGRLVSEVRLQSGMLDLSGLAPGVYSVLLMDVERPGRVLHRQRLIKMQE